MKESQQLRAGLMGYFLKQADDSPRTNFPIVLGVSETEDGLPIGSGALEWNSRNKARIAKRLQKDSK